VLRGATLIDGTGAPPFANAVIAIRGGTIAAVGPIGAVAYDPASPTRDLAGKTVLPGFIDVHAHTNALAIEDLKRWTRAGVTTVRDLEGPREPIIARRNAVAASGDPALPRLLVAGPMITVPGGHPIPIYGLSDQVLAVRGAEDARAQTLALLDAGVDVIKIAVSGRTDVDWPELSDAEIAAIAAAARERGVRVAAHVDRSAGLRRAVEKGITDAAHMPRDRMPDPLIALMVSRGVVMSPTIAVYEALAAERGGLAEWRRATMPVMYDNLRRYVAAGGLLALGDDYGNPGIALGMPITELRHWIAAGLTPMQAIAAATHGSALACGLAGRLGAVQPGLAADLLVVLGDPLTDLGALEQVALVVHGGAIVRE
jgi:imidazolonepropionase-like amidohydrolase